MHTAPSYSWAHGRSRPSGTGWIRAKHADSGAELGATQRHHVLSNMSSDDVTMLRAGVGKDVLDQVVAILVAGDVDERNSRAVGPPLTDSIQVAAEKLWAANLQTLLDDLGGELVRAVLGSIADDVVDSTTAVGWGSVFADMLDTPVPKLSMCNNVNVGQDFLDARSLRSDGLAFPQFLPPHSLGQKTLPCLLQGSFRICSGQPNCQSRQGQLRATYHGALH